MVLHKSGSGFILLTRRALGERRPPPVPTVHSSMIFKIYNHNHYIFWHASPKVSDTVVLSWSLIISVFVCIYYLELFGNPHLINVQADSFVIISLHNKVSIWNFFTLHKHRNRTYTQPSATTLKPLILLQCNFLSEIDFTLLRWSKRFQRSIKSPGVFTAESCRTLFAGKNERDQTQTKSMKKKQNKLTQGLKALSILF